MRREIQRFHVGALADFFSDLEFTVTVPEQFGLFQLVVSKLGGFDFELEPLAGQGALFALGVAPSQRSEAKDGRVYEEDRQQGATDEEARVPAQCRVQLVDKGLHFGEARYNNFLCPANN